MRTCSNCGATVREGAKFCTSCGTRLNDAAVTSQHDTWSAPATDEAAAEQTAPSGTDATTGQEATPPAGPASGGGQEGFSWSWGSASPPAQAAGEDGTAQVDEESGTVLDEADTTGAEAAEIADATEVEILEEEPATSDEELAVTLGTSESASNDEDTSAPDTVSAEEGDATLAAWAGQWSDDERFEAAPLRASSTGEASPTTGSTEDTMPESRDEDTVEKAERLLAELRRIIPSLARPRPIDPNARSEGHTVLVGGRTPLPDLAAELDEARSGETFDDLRATVETARQNPRDVDTMLSLAGQAERLLALLDDRDRLAGKLESIASRLRETVSSEQESGDGPNLRKVL